MSQSRNKKHLTRRQRLALYFDDLGSNGGVAPAHRFRLEGYLQAQLDGGYWLEADLREVIQTLINTFNTNHSQQLKAQPEAWRLPHVAPIAPVQGE